MLPSFRISRYAAVPLLAFLLAATGWGQQTYVTRFDLFAGYTYLNSPHVGLAEHGFHTQAGVRRWTWMRRYGHHPGCGSSSIEATASRSRLRRTGG